MTTLIAAALLAASLVAVRTGGGPDPSAPATSFRATVRGPAGAETVAWQPGRLRVRVTRGAGVAGETAERDGTIVYRYAPGSPLAVRTRTFAAEPDAFEPVEQLRGPSDFVLAQARGGELKLRSVSVDGVAAWHASVFAPANKCAAFPSGTTQLWLRQRDLLPLRVVEQRGSRRTIDIAIRYASVGAALPARTFALPAPAGAHRDDEGFVRATPAAAAAHLPYVPQLPAALPAGFELAVTGWARQGATTGAEGSIPPRPNLFAAVYRRGIEHVDFTQRSAQGEDWPDDPFGAECVLVRTQRTRIGGDAAHSAAGNRTVPHLWWRHGDVLYTLSGPFSRTTLVAIASSLRPYSSPR